MIDLDEASLKILENLSKFSDEISIQIKIRPFNPNVWYTRDSSSLVAEHMTIRTYIKTQIDQYNVRWSIFILNLV